MTAAERQALQQDTLERIRAASAAERSQRPHAAAPSPEATAERTVRARELVDRIRERDAVRERPAAPPPRPKLVAADYHAATVRELAQAQERLELANAELAAARADLAAMVRIIRRTGGYMRVEDQMAVFGAEARIAAAV
jgi:hypothetical protein